jgi:hypothetical protein
VSFAYRRKHSRRTAPSRLLREYAKAAPSLPMRHRTAQSRRLLKRATVAPSLVLLVSNPDHIRSAQCKLERRKRNARAEPACRRTKKRGKQKKTKKITTKTSEPLFVVVFLFFSVSPGPPSPPRPAPRSLSPREPFSFTRRQKIYRRHPPPKSKQKRRSPFFCSGRAYARPNNKSASPHNKSASPHFHPPTIPAQPEHQ